MTDTPEALQALTAQRVEYGRLGSAQADTDPFGFFSQWYADAHRTLGEPNAMVLSTSGAEGPTARIVLLKGFDPEGFVFYTNYESAKGRQIAEDPRAALVFPWHDMQRQVRVRGIASRVSAEASDEYFALRPRGAQLSAVASRQSAPVESRERMQAEYARVEKEFEGRPVTRPEHWGGYIVRPVEIEFWQGQANRFHDRFVYRTGDGAVGRMDDAATWTVVRLDP